MKYGNLQLHYKPSSLVEVPTKDQRIRKYPGSNKSKAIQLGQSATKISCILLARTEKDHRAIRQSYHNEQETELYIYSKGYYYKQVLVSDMQARGISGDAEEITIEFTALDPVPYDAKTDEQIY